MGNYHGVCTVYPRSEKLSKYLTDRQVKIIQQTWAIIRQDVKRTGIIIFTKFFDQEAEMKKYFPKMVTMNDRNELSTDMDRDRLETHALTVMEGLGAAVESLDDTEFLNNVLFAIGQSHVKRKIKPYMLQKLWPSMDYGFREVLKEKYTKETMEAWKKVYWYIKARMSEGIRDAERKKREGAKAAGAAAHDDEDDADSTFDNPYVREEN
ncbi:cytoglobin-1-like [Liolophura sinensis]|uniref:cytoglobin-1-like n=1 Tax=Liolophura sinensis TaxID=3198878 RepID=UPI003158726E